MTSLATGFASRVMRLAPSVSSMASAWGHRWRKSSTVIVFMAEGHHVSQGRTGQYRHQRGAPPPVTPPGRSAQGRMFWFRWKTLSGS